jgi:NAD(P)-dependent dehydrogenase (short-subunit alcohol dehydrogenase family)
MLPEPTLTIFILYPGCRTAFFRLCAPWLRETSRDGVRELLQDPERQEQLLPCACRCQARRSQSATPREMGESWVAVAVAFLASQDASYITGVEINVDGGLGQI